MSDAWVEGERGSGETGDSEVGLSLSLGAGSDAVAASACVRLRDSLVEGFGK